MSDPIKHVDYVITKQDVINEIEQLCLNDLYMDSVKELKTAPESQFIYCMRVIGRKFFTGTDYFKDAVNINNFSNPRNMIDIYNIYIDLCNMFAKVPSFLGFCSLVGADYCYIYDKYIKGNYNNINNIYNNNSNSSNNNGNDNNSIDNNINDFGKQSSPFWSQYYRKIDEERNRALRSKLSDGKQNPVGIIALMNNEYNFNGDKPESEQDRKCLSVNDLKQLLSVTSGQHNQNHIGYNTQKKDEKPEVTGFLDGAK